MKDSSNGMKVIDYANLKLLIREHFFFLPRLFVSGKEQIISQMVKKKKSHRQIDRL